MALSDFATMHDSIFESTLNNYAVPLMDKVSRWGGVRKNFHECYGIFKDILRADPILSKQWKGGDPESFEYDYIEGENPVHDYKHNVIKSCKHRYMKFDDVGTVRNLAAFTLSDKILDPIDFSVHDYLFEEGRIDEYYHGWYGFLWPSCTWRLYSSLANYIFTHCNPRLLKASAWSYRGDGVIFETTYYLRNLYKIL